MSNILNCLNKHEMVIEKNSVFVYKNYHIY